MGRDTTTMAPRARADGTWRRIERAPSVDAMAHLARAQEAVARARAVASKSAKDASPAAVGADPAGAPPAHLSRAQQAVAKAREVAARFRATYGPDAPAAAGLERQPRMPDLPWEKQRLKLDLPGDKQPLRLDLPKGPERRRLDLPGAESDRLEAAPASPGGGGGARFVRTSAAARRDIPDDPRAEPWSCLPLDQLSPDQGSRWQRLVGALAAPWGGPRRGVDRRKDPRAAPLTPGRRGVNATREHEIGRAIPLAPGGSGVNATREHEVGRAVPLARDAPERPLEAAAPTIAPALAAAEAAPADDAEASEPGHLLAARAPVPFPAESFHRAARIGARRRWLAQGLAWLFGRGTAGAAPQTGAPPALPTRAPDPGGAGRASAPAAAGALAVVRRPGLPAPLPRLARAGGAGGAGGRRRAASWRLATRTLLVGGLGVLCGALLTELVAQPGNNALARLVERWWAQLPVLEQAGPDVNAPEADQSAVPTLAEHPSATGIPGEPTPLPEPAGGAAAAVVAPTETRPAGAGPPEATRPVPVPRPAEAGAQSAAGSPDRAAIALALEAAGADPASAELVGIIRADPARWDAFYELGYRLQVQGHLPEAGALYREAARLDPTHAATFYDWGYVLQRQGDRDGAIDKYRTAIRLHSKNPYAYYNLGFLLQRAGDVAAALEHYRIAAELDLRNPFLYYNWGTLLERQGDIAGAIARYREASRLQPDASPGTDARVRIAELSARQDGTSATP